MKRTGTLLLALFLGVCFGSRCGATVYSSDGSAQNVQYVHDNLSHDGDTITLPAGTFSWTTRVNVTKAITIKGQTTVDSDHGTANDQTILVDNLVRHGGREGFINSVVQPGKFVRVTGITFTGVGGLTTTMSNGAVIFACASTGNTAQARVDHCHFTAMYQLNYVAVYNGMYGVMDHCLLNNIPSQMGQQRVYNGIDSYGDQEFAQSAGYGGPNFWFFEDNYCVAQNGDYVQGGVDALNGGKFVVRHCHLFDVQILNHGTEYDRARGGRAQEIYNNDYHWTYSTALDGIRTGSVLFHDNTFDGVIPQGFSLTNYRTFWNFGGTWGGADGTSGWDYNVTEADGTHVDGHPPYLFESGTLTSGNSTTLTDTSKNWTPNRWVGYAVKRVSDKAMAQIQSNTNNTLTVLSWQPVTWGAGNQYQIHKILLALDQPCRGAGILVSGSNPTPFWPNPALEPCYSWNNIYSPGGAHVNLIRFWTMPPQALIEGRDYFNDTPMPGYTPYVYPHPLVNGSPAPTPTPTATPTPAATPTATPAPIDLIAQIQRIGGINITHLKWRGAASANIDVYRNGVVIATTPNDQLYDDSTGTSGQARFTYKVCEAGTRTCSDMMAVNFPP
ncbi:MAG TPA: hypothetical protein VGM65_02675 [Candidatus Udaeobacter sp.]